VNVSPSLRAFGVLVLIAAVITALQLGFGLVVILRFLQILFLVAIAYVLFVLWRRNREDIAMWSRRSRAPSGSTTMSAMFWTSRTS